MSESVATKKRGWPKGKRRKKLFKDGNPKKTRVTGYVLFMNQRREALMKENIGLSFAEITKILGEEWSAMAPDKKSIFLNAAEKQREANFKKLKTHQQSEVLKKQTKNSANVNVSSGSSSRLDGRRMSSKGFDDPIFTESFLDYNKAKESELHQLNRTNAEYEQHNFVLEGHIDNLKNAIIKLESETQLQTSKNKSLDSKLLYFKELLCIAFSSISLPNTTEFPSVQNIDSYLQQMCNILELSNGENAQFASAVYDAMTAVSFQSLDAYWNENKFGKDSTAFAS